MQINDTTPAPHSAKAHFSKTDILRKRIDELAKQGLLTEERRRQLKELLVRIDLSSASPFGQEHVPGHWISVTESLEAARRETILLPTIDDELRNIVTTLQETEVCWSRPLDVLGCRICGRTHPLKIRHLAFAKPDAWFYLSSADAQRRCEGDDNFLSIDRQRFFIRGILPVLAADQVINIMVWAELEHYNFAQFIDLLLGKERRANQLELKFEGILANRLIPTLKNVGESINVVCSSASPPKFWLNKSASALWRAQSGGMDSEMMTILFSQFAHSQFLQERLMPSAPQSNSAVKTC